VCRKLDLQHASLLPRPCRESVPCIRPMIQVSIADYIKLKLVPRVLCTRIKLSTRQKVKKRPKVSLPTPRPPHPKRIKVATMLTWAEHHNEAIVRHALRCQDANNIYTWRSLLQNRSELFEHCTSRQLRERAVQISRGLIDVAFKRKFRIELRQLKKK